VACAESRWPSASEALRRAISVHVRFSPMGFATSFTARPAISESVVSVSCELPTWSATTRPGTGCCA
jgi:hypothetical protein